MKRLLNAIGTLFLVGLLITASGAVQAQTTGDYGDAPEGGIAYPSLGVIGAFPTCMQMGPAGFVYHNAIGNCARFGPTVDFEPDGNAGICQFPPYNQDECSPTTDNDAGLVKPDAYTIAGGIVVPCGATTGRDLGQVCTTATWGPAGNIDIQVTNNCATGMFVNVLMDWDMSGTWGGGSPCPLAAAREWVLVNCPVPPGYNGLLSALGPLPFLIGPHAGHVWCRFTISNLPVTGNDWDGSGQFELGETEDYLLRVLPEEETGEYGDAPEGAIAYPTLGIMGAFPTCVATGPAGWVYHAPQGCCWFGPTVDFEVDGNAGTCVFPAYDRDECGPTTDNDAGLIFPDPYTIAGGVEVLCRPFQLGRALGGVCTTAGWSPAGNVDILVTNTCTTVKFVNVVMDWNQNGAWGGSSACPAGPAPEWVLVNFPVPPGYNGPLSGLGPPSFLIGPRSGFVWARFTISDQFLQVSDWDGSGSFATGESEDYLLRVDPRPEQGDYGDAPEQAPAYPLLGITGQFPTCVFIGAPGSYVYHAPLGQSWFGPLVDFETDGNAGNCVYPLYDQDECGPGGGDAGLTLPQTYTIDATGSIVPCPPLTQRPNLGWYCLQSHWGANLDLGVHNPGPLPHYVNILADWNQDGSWSGSVTCPGAGLIPEHLLVNLPVPPGYVGKLSNLVSGPFWVPAQPGFVWLRCTISDVQVAPGWDGSGVFGDGETEDYLVRVEDQQSSVPEPGRPTSPPGLMLEPNTPNPFNPTTRVAFRLPTPGIVKVTIADIAGRVVRVLVDQAFEPGRHTLTWDGRDDRGVALGSGLYFIRAEADGVVRTQKVLMTR